MKAARKGWTNAGFSFPGQSCASVATTVRSQRVCRITVMIMIFGTFPDLQLQLRGRMGRGDRSVLLFCWQIINWPKILVKRLEDNGTLKWQLWNSGSWFEIARSEVTWKGHPAEWVAVSFRLKIAGIMPWRTIAAIRCVWYERYYETWSRRDERGNTMAATQIPLRKTDVNFGLPLVEKRFKHGMYFCFRFYSSISSWV